MVGTNSSPQGTPRISSNRLRRSSRRRRRRIATASVVVFLCALAAYGAFYLWKRGMLPANQVAKDWYEAKSAQEPLVQLPKDDAPHDNYIEWWYYNGHLAGQGDRHYSFHFAVFQIKDIWSHYVAHVALLDHQSGKYYTDQMRTTTADSSSKADGFDFTIGKWYLSGIDGDDRLRVATPQFSLSLNMKQSAPPVYQGGTGLLDFGQAGKSYYYTRPRMEIDGAINVNNNTEIVSGLAWFDHQWGDFRIKQLGWDWFAIQLENGSNIMIYQLFDTGGLPVLRSGTLAKGATTQVLTEQDFKVTVTDYWVSRTTGISYPIAWRIEIPKETISLDVVPVSQHSEFDGRKTTYTVYWEGPVRISGTHGGRGFVELSGYQKPSNDQPVRIEPKS